MTSNPMMICEELECDFVKVESVFADPNRHVRQKNAYDHLHTEASSSVRLGRALYQQVGASARERLKAAAAQQWGVPVGEVDKERRAGHTADRAHTAARPSLRSRIVKLTRNRRSRRPTNSR
jgi:isoquinoline 1-oxidoreductase beta subunit